MGSRGEELWPYPGRVFAVGPAHTFADLARAIDNAFARWDLSHLSLFTLADGRVLTDAETGADLATSALGGVKVQRFILPKVTGPAPTALAADARRRSDQNRAGPMVTPLGAPLMSQKADTSSGREQTPCHRHDGTHDLRQIWTFAGTVVSVVGEIVGTVEVVGAWR